MTKAKLYSEIQSGLIHVASGDLSVEKCREVIESMIDQYVLQITEKAVGEEEQEIMNIVRDIFNAGYKYNPANDYDLRPFTNKIKKIMNQHTTSIIEQAVGEITTGRTDMAYVVCDIYEQCGEEILSRIKTEIGGTE